MTYRFGASVAAVAIVAAATASIIHGASKNFAPDVVFTGSSLTGWQPIGQSTWRAENGEIIGTPTAAGGGWLLADKPYQDVAVFASFRCAAGCQTGVMLRAEKTAEGGVKGVFVSLNEGDLAAYRVTLDRQGAQTSKERLRGPGGGQLRVAPPPQNPPPAARQRAREARPHCRRFPAASRRPFRVRPPDCAPATGTRSNWCSMPTSFARFSTTSAASATPLPRPSTAPTVRSRSMWAERVKCGSRTSRTRICNRESREPEQVSSKFRMQTLNEFYYSWGPAVADFNRDGTPDIVAGPYYYLGPQYTDGSRDLHRRDDRSGHAVLQRPAVRLRLHRRRMARRAELGLPADGDSLRESQRGVAALGYLHGHRSHVVRVHAAQGRRRGRQARVPLQGQREQVRLREARSGQSDGPLDEARDQRARPVGEPRHGCRRCERRRARRFPERLRLVGAARSSRVRESRSPGVQRQALEHGSTIRRRLAGGRDRVRAAPRWRSTT